jgi:hypothetical protein
MQFIMCVVFDSIKIMNWNMNLKAAQLTVACIACIRAFLLKLWYEWQALLWLPSQFKTCFPAPFLKLILARWQ